MTSTGRSHIVGKQELLVWFDSYELARTGRERLDSIARDELPRVLDEVFSLGSRQDELVQLERLELDLGAVDPSRFETEFLARLRVRLTAVLGKRIQAIQSAPELERNGRIVSVRRFRLESLGTFLETGHLAPRGGATVDPERLARGVLHDSADALVAMLSGVSYPERVARRIVGQLSPGLAERIFLRLAGSRAAELNRQAVEWLCILEKDPADSPTSRVVARFDDGSIGTATAIVTEVKWTLLIEAKGRTVALDAFSPNVFRRVAERTRSLLAALRLELGTAALEKLPPESRVRRWLIQDSLEPAPVSELKTTPAEVRPKRSPPAPPVGDRSGEPAENVASAEVVEDGGFQRVEHAAHFSQPIGHREPPPVMEESLDKSTRPADGRGARAAGVEPESPQAADPRLPAHPTGKDADVRRPTTPSPEPGASEGLYIDNAGLVLVWPFLERFFGAIGLVEDKQFRSDHARQRAAMLLQYVTTGQSGASEHLLPLNKLVCGCPMEEPLSRWFEPTPKETEETNALLGAVIEHWAALKKTSPDGLRQSFLQREGHLQLLEADQGWKLRIARTGFDVLIDQLPWGMGFVLLPWMPSPLLVEW